MTSIRESIRRFFTLVQPLPAGTYHYQAPPGAPLPYRLHLRVEAGGCGVLIVNAATVLHLNQTATEYAYHLIRGTPKTQVASEVASRYRVSRQRAQQDFDDFVDRLQTLIQTPDLDPVTYLDFDRYAPYSQGISAPYRLDCALTYRLPEGADPAAALSKRVDRELTTAEWQIILNTAWKAGIPQVIFTGGEPTLRDDLPTLIAHAEQNGQVSGLLSDGLKLADTAYLNTLLQTGLDHLMLVFQPDNETAWESLKNTLAADLFVVVHLTLTPQNVAQIPGWLEQLAALGTRAVSLSGTSPTLNAELQAARDRAAALGLSLVWDIPVPYSMTHPVALETAEDEPVQGAGYAWLYVEPDGDVLPTQGIPRVLGNLLRDPWETIWAASRS
jgi:hypothetical protein